VGAQVGAQVVRSWVRRWVRRWVHVVFGSAGASGAAGGHDTPDAGVCSAVAHVVPLVHMALVVHVVRACGAAVLFRRIQSSSGAFS